MMEFVFVLLAFGWVIFTDWLFGHRLGWSFRNDRYGFRPLIGFLGLLLLLFLWPVKARSENYVKDDCPKGYPPEFCRAWNYAKGELMRAGYGVGGVKIEEFGVNRKLGEVWCDRHGWVHGCFVAEKGGGGVIYYNGLLPKRAQVGSPSRWSVMLHEATHALLWSAGYPTWNQGEPELELVGKVR